MATVVAKDIWRGFKIFYKTMMIANLANRDPSWKVTLLRDEFVAPCSIASYGVDSVILR